MKQKNLILIAVAVVCGLVAAFLTARLSAGSGKTKVDDFVDLPVAARDIPIGTKIPTKDLEQFFVLKKFPKETVPPTAVKTIEEIADKRTMRQVRQGEMLSGADITARGFLDPPSGTMLMTTPCSLDQGASGFALPGSHVMVVATKKSQKKNMDIVFPLFLDLLVLAVDTNPAPPQVNNGGGTSGQPASTASAAGFQQMSMISFAVNPEQSILLTMAADGGARLRLGLPSQDETSKQLVMDGYKHLVPTTEQIRKIFADKWDEEKPVAEAPKVETVKVRVPAEFIATGSQLTSEVLEKKFKDIDYPKEFLPEGTFTDPKDLKDQYALADLVPSLLVAKNHVAKEKPKPSEVNPVVVSGSIAGAKVQAPESDVAYPKAFVDTEPKVAPPKKREYVYVTIHTAQGKKIQRFEKTPDGNKFVDEVIEGSSETAPAK